MCLVLTQRSYRSNLLNHPSNINSHLFQCLTLGRLDNVKSPNRTAISYLWSLTVCVFEVPESLLVQCRYSEANQRLS